MLRQMLVLSIMRRTMSEATQSVKALVPLLHVTDAQKSGWSVALSCRF